MKAKILARMKTCRSLIECFKGDDKMVTRYKGEIKGLEYALMVHEGVLK